jgi:hypothetical protein
MRSQLRFPIIAAALLAALACSESSSPTESGQPVASVSIGAVTGTLWVGATRQLVATPRSADGTALTGREIVWSGGDGTIAVIDAAGRVEARGAGTTVIVATSEGKRAELQIVVSEVDLLFEGYRTGFPEMFVLSLRGSGEPTRLLPPNTFVTDPKPSPDGSRLAGLPLALAMKSVTVRVSGSKRTSLKPTGSSSFFPRVANGPRSPLSGMIALPTNSGSGAFWGT